MSRVDLRAQLLKCSDMEIHGPRADGAAAGKRNAGATETRDKRSKRQDGRAHRFYKFIRRDCVVESGCFHHVIRRGEISRGHVGAHVRDQFAHGDDVAYARDVVQRDSILREQRRRHRRQRRVLRAADDHRAVERLSAAYQEFVHARPVPLTKFIRRALAANCRGRGPGGAAPPAR